jgi:guanosine-3',5'-bis(diphosphate) 3'-pyrophosphohydrolase
MECKGKTMNSDFVLILKAASFAADKHRGQLRKEAESTAYINHPLQVARILAEDGAVSDPEIIAAALLHDTIEEAHTTESELAAHFGVRVASIVAEVTDDKSIVKEERKRLQVVNAPHKSPGAALVKLADKTSNVRDVGARPAAGWSEERRLGYLEWAKKVVDALPVSNHPLKDAFETSLASSVALVRGKRTQTAPHGVRV